MFQLCRDDFFILSCWKERHCQQCCKALVTSWTESLVLQTSNYIFIKNTVCSNNWTYAVTLHTVHIVIFISSCFLFIRFPIITQNAGYDDNDYSDKYSYKP